MKRSKFSLSHYRLLSCDMGELVPIGLTEVLPGDTFQHATSLLVRVSPMLAPVMHPVHVRIHHWYVPTRLVWDDFEKFITGGPDGMDASVAPTISLTWAAGSPPTGSNVIGQLPDYLGVPPEINGLVVSAIPFRAYGLIFNEWYRDQDLQTPLTVATTSGADTTTNVALQNVAWEKDYFTSARPWTQKGPEVNIPLSGALNVLGLGITPTATAPAGSGTTFKEAGNPAGRVYANHFGAGAWNTNAGLEASGSGASATPMLRLDGNTAGMSINDLRLGFALQRYEEARARYGSRYTEYLAYLGVRSSDARLQRPEYLGGGKQTIQFSEVLSTADGGAALPVGSLKGHGIGAVRSNRYRRFFEEHGYVITLMSVKPRTMYVQGLHKTWRRATKEDYWQQELQHIGQQEIQDREVYASNGANGPAPDGVFGYQDRYDEYRRQESLVTGEFRSSTLNFWHMARIFSSKPVLNASFIKSNPTKRINAVQTNDVLWIMANHSLQARRKVARTGTSFIF